MTPQRRQRPEAAPIPSHPRQGFALVGPFGRATMVAVGLAVATSSLALTACSDPPPPPPPPPPPAVPVSLWSIDDIDMPQRVDFPEKYLPSTTVEQNRDIAQAAADVAAALVEGDAELMASRVGPSDDRVLESLTASEEFITAARSLVVARIVRLDQSSDGIELGIAIENDLGAFLTAWRAAPESDGMPVFESMAIQPQLAARAQMLDDAEFLEPMFDAFVDAEELIEQAEQRENTRGTGGSESSTFGGPSRR